MYVEDVIQYYVLTQTETAKEERHRTGDSSKIIR